MAKSNLPFFAKDNKSGYATAVAAATFDTDTPTNTLPLITAGAEGMLLTSLSVLPRATYTACQLMVWKASSGAPAVKNLALTAPAPGATISATAQTVPIVFKHPGTETPISGDYPYRLEAGESLYFGASVALAAGFKATAVGVDF